MVPLSEHGWERTLALLVRYVDMIPAADVVPQLEGLDGAKLHEYLHALFLRDADAGAAYAGRQLGLYGVHAPKLLLPFLKGSRHYPLELALAATVEHGLDAARVYVLGRMERTAEAIALMLNRLGDMGGAIALVLEKRDASLWHTLLGHTMRSPPLVDALLEHVCAQPLLMLDTIALVQQLPDGVGVPRLKERLLRLLRQSAARTELTANALRATRSDCAALLRERHQLLAQGARVNAPPDAPAGR